MIHVHVTNSSGRVVPEHSPIHDGEECWDTWGFTDSRFEVERDGAVRFTGSRYPLAGSVLPDLLPFFRKALQVDFDPLDLHDARTTCPPPAARSNGAFLQQLQQIVSAEAISTDDRERLRHGHGHTIEEMYAVKYGHFQRVPDLVVFPSNENEIARIVEAALQHDVMLVPYGGGTNVTNALFCSAAEERMIVAVDLRRLDRVLWIDPVNQMACIEAGAVGRHIQQRLARHGFTLGHEPDSIEFSTLGGWIATNASGMKKNRYGNIEDIVIDVHAITARGMLARAAESPRSSIGSQPQQLLFGSEGNLGIITRAVVKIFPLPEVQRYDAIAFPSFEDGVGFMQDLARAGPLPASVRLVDTLQFQLSQTFRPRRNGIAALKRRAEKAFVTRLRGFDPERMVACTLLYEGSREEVAAQRSAVRRAARKHRGLNAGAENGERGYQLTFSIAYLRDFAVDHYIVAESLETAVPWSLLLPLCERVKARVHQEHAARGLPGRPFVSCRVTQTYQTGVCVYFYIAFYHKGVDYPEQRFAELERAARDEILNAGGSLSHHHGVGKIRRDFLSRVHSPATLEWLREIKKAVDPTNVFGIGNTLPTN